MNTEVNEAAEMTSPAPGESTVSIKKVKKEKVAAKKAAPKKSTKAAPKAKEKKVVAKKATKAAPKAKKEKATKAAGEGKRGRTSQYAGLKIYKLVPKNPRREGTAGHNSFSLITNGMKYEKFIELGGRSGDLAFDIAHKYVEVKNA